MNATQIYETAAEVLFDPSDAADIAVKCDDYVRVDRPGASRPLFAFVEAVRDDGQLLVRDGRGVLRWVWNFDTTIMLTKAALELTSAREDEAARAV